MKKFHIFMVGLLVVGGLSASSVPNERIIVSEAIKAGLRCKALPVTEGLLKKVPGLDKIPNIPTIKKGDLVELANVALCEAGVAAVQKQGLPDKKDGLEIADSVLAQWLSNCVERYVYLPVCNAVDAEGSQSEFSNAAVTVALKLLLTAYAPWHGEDKK